LLYLVEYANTNSQTKIGKGISELSYSTGEKVTVASTGNTIIVSSATGANYRVGQYVDVSTTLGTGNICSDREITDISAPTDGNVTITVDGNPFTTNTNSIIYHIRQTTGGCDSLNGVSGNARMLPGDGTISVNYRGIEDLWGNIWEFVDGINIKNKDDLGNMEQQPYIADSGFVSNSFAGNYNASGLILPVGNGYVKNFGYSTEADWLLMPNEVEGTAGTYVTDYFGQSWGDAQNKVAVAGAAWADWAGAGLFRWDAGNTSLTAWRVIGTRVLLIP
jgi:hypothetical protein